MFNKKLDIAHIFFLELLRDFKNNLGVPLATRQLLRKTVSLAQNLPRIDFPNKNIFWEAIRKEETNLHLWEDKLEICKNNIIAAPKCTFRNAIDNYLKLWGGMPTEYAEITEEFNKTSTISSILKIGQGSACSPFCLIHQALRSIAVKKIYIASEPLNLVMLGSKLSNVDLAISYEYLAEEGIKPAHIKTLLQKNICCFLIKFPEK